MIFVTSIAPKHHFENRQSECTASWTKWGKVYSINSPQECKELKELYPHVEFVETGNTMEYKFGKPYVSLNPIMEFLIMQGGGVLINSDIELTQDETIWNKALEIYKDKTKFLYLHRFDFDVLKSRSRIYRDGVDVFFFHPEYVNFVPENEFCLGHCYFDIMLPWWMIMNGLKGAAIHSVPIAFHQRHPARYKPEDWDYYGQHSAKFLGITQKSAVVSERIYRFIRANTEYL